MKFFCVPLIQNLYFDNGFDMLAFGVQNWWLGSDNNMSKLFFSLYKIFKKITLMNGGSI